MSRNRMKMLFEWPFVIPIAPLQSEDSPDFISSLAFSPLAFCQKTHAQVWKSPATVRRPSSSGMKENELHPQESVCRSISLFSVQIYSSWATTTDVGGWHLRAPGVRSSCWQSRIKLELTAKKQKKKSQRRMIWKANGRNPMKSVVEDFCAHGDRSCTFPSSHSLEWRCVSLQCVSCQPPLLRAHILKK